MRGMQGGCMNIFIEGLQGMGKSTLLHRLSEIYPDYHVYREGDYCPIELAWCSYMTKAEYAVAIRQYPALTGEIERWTTREQYAEDKYIVQYTRILTDEPGFHQYMSQFEIYNGRKTLEEFEEIIFRRYRNLPTENAGNLFECAFLQNIMEEFILYQQLPDNRICSFYRKLFEIIPKTGFRLLYLYDDKIEEAIRQISLERSDAEGNPFWYPLMIEYLKNSPYGKKHNLQGFSDLISHFRHRQQLEMQIIREMPEGYAVILPAKKYTDETLRSIE